MWSLVKFLAICLRSTCVVGRRRGSAKEAVIEPGQAELAQLSPGQKSESESESESDRCEAEAQDDRSRRMKTGKRGGGAEESIPFRRKDNPAPAQLLRIQYYDATKKVRQAGGIRIRDERGHFY